MQDNQLHVETGDDAESLPESIIKAVVITLPVVLQLLTLFRRPKAATATVGVAVAPAASGVGSATPPKVLTETK